MIASSILGPLDSPLLLAVMGPTASGKTALAERLADELGAILINADAFQIYRGLDIGTSKPLRKDRYALLDIRDPNEGFGLGEWIRLTLPILEDAFGSNRNAIVVGGTGLYIRALLEEYSSIAAVPDAALRRRLNEAPIFELRKHFVAKYPDVAARTDLANPVRVRRALERANVEPGEPIRLPSFRKLKFGISRPPEGLSACIAHRLGEMVQNGWVQEVRRLQERGFRREDPGLRAIGYRSIWDLLERKIGLEEAIAKTVVETRQYAKRQRTWLRSEPNLVELSATTENEAFDYAMERIGSVLM